MTFGDLEKITKSLSDMEVVIDYDIVDRDFLETSEAFKWGIQDLPIKLYIVDGIVVYWSRSDQIIKKDVMEILVSSESHKDFYLPFRTHEVIKLIIKYSKTKNILRLL